MKTIAAWLIKVVMSFGLAKLAAWWDRKQAEKAKHKAEQLEAYMKGKDAAEKEEAEYIEADRKLKEEQAKVKTYEDKLAKLEEMYG